MLIVPDRQSLGRQWIKISLDHGRLKAQLEMLVQKCVERRASHCVVVVREMLAPFKKDAALLAVRRVELLQFGETLTSHLPGPVICSIHALWPRRAQGSEFDIARIHSQQTRVLASAATLHGRADHDNRKGEFDAVIDCRQYHRLGPSAARAGNGNTLRVDLWQAE